MAAITDRERAREILTRNAEHRPEFSTFDPAIIREYAARCLRWIDCAPEGARFLVAPLQGLDGAPLSGRPIQGPQGAAGKRLREARAARGLDPIRGRVGV